MTWSIDESEGLAERPADAVLSAAEFLLLWRLERKVHGLMAGIDDLNAAVRDLQTQVTAENAELEQVAAALQASVGQIAQLQAQIAAGDGVTDADLETLAQTIAGVAQSAAAATANAAAPAPAAPSDPGAPAPDPSAPEPSAPAPDPSAPAPDPAPVTDGGTAAPDPAAPPAGSDPAGEPAPAAPSDPSGSGPIERPAASQSVYTFDGDASTVDSTVWPSTGLETTDDPPKLLFYYSGDTSPGDTNGDGVASAWHLYTGSVQAVEAPADPSAGGEA